MHTPEEAKNLWCPMVRAARHDLQTGSVVGGCNTDAQGGARVPGTCRCIADKCAMWRWQTKLEHVARYRVMCPDTFATVEPQRPHGLNPKWEFTPYNQDDDELACWAQPEEMRTARRKGYCGLAGMVT